MAKTASVPTSATTTSTSPTAANGTQVAVSTGTITTTTTNSECMLAGVRASNEKLRLEIKTLKKDLEAERRNIKELFVLHQGDLRQVRAQEQDRAQALLCDLK